MYLWENGGGNMNECQFYTAMEVAKMLGVSKGHAYKVVKNLNDELKSKGFIVIAGKVSKQYFNERCYGMSRV